MRVLLWYTIGGSLLGTADKHPETGLPLTRYTATQFANQENAKEHNQKRAVRFVVRIIAKEAV